MSVGAVRIFDSHQSDTMLLGSAAALRALHERIAAFLDSNDDTLDLPFETHGDPAPYERFLPGLRLAKSNEPICLARDGLWLRLRGGPDALRRYASFLLFPPDTESAHHHPDNVEYIGGTAEGSLRLVIEADAHWFSVPPLRWRVVTVTPSGMTETVIATGSMDSYDPDAFSQIVTDAVTSTKAWLDARNITHEAAATLNLTLGLWPALGGKGRPSFHIDANAIKALASLPVAIDFDPY